MALGRRVDSERSWDRYWEDEGGLGDVEGNVIVDCGHSTCHTSTSLGFA